MTLAHSLSAMVRGLCRLGRRARQATPPRSDERRPPAGTFLMLALAACSAAGEGPEHVVAPLVLSPAGVDAELVAAHAERWSRATGLPIEVRDGGAPVTFDAMTSELNAGETAVQWRHDAPSEILWIHIDERRDHDRSLVSHILLHEMGHAVCEYGILGQTDDNCHSHTGLMHGSVLGEPCIDAASLETVCGYRDCAAFTPEC